MPAAGRCTPFADKPTEQIERWDRKTGHVAGLDLAASGTAAGGRFGRRQQDRKAGCGHSIQLAAAGRGRDNDGFVEKKPWRAQRKDR